MSKNCVGEYLYKGFLIRWSDYYDEWFLEPTFLGDSLNAINFSTDYANSGESFRTIKEAKEYIRENIDGLKEECLQLYKDYCNRE